MNLHDYFEQTDGIGILATADANGLVDTAVYARPHVLEDGSLAFIMLDRLTHHNLQSNPHASYLFIERGAGYRGRRLYLTKLHEETDPDRIAALRRRPSPGADPEAKRFLVTFRLDRELPLLGSGQTPE